MDLKQSDRRCGESRPGETIPESTDVVARAIVDAAFRVHTALGPGLLESVYETCLVHEISRHGLQVQRQLLLPIQYDGIQIDAGLKLDLFVNACVVVELKSVEKLLPIHEAQLLTYLKLANCRLGLLINFNVPLIKNGIRRLAR
jgi:GxxExxY protein